MTTGLSGSYAINGTNLLLQPEEHKWSPRDALGIDGNSHPIYPAIRNYEMSWGLMDMASFQQLVAFYNQVQNTGTCTVDLPQWGASDFRFYSYSGCTISEPEIGGFFTEHVSSVRLVIMNVRT